MKLIFLSVLYLCYFKEVIPESSVPLVINTWFFTNATAKAWDVLNTEGMSAVDAVELGCTVCEDQQCDGTVGFGGSPDENGETTLDAMIFDGDTMNMGAVGGIRRVKHAVSTARLVLERTGHSILVGSLASKFAFQMGLKSESLSTNHSIQMWEEWKNKKCQPNFWMNVLPDPKSHCGPYKPRKLTENKLDKSGLYDTITMVVIDKNGHIVAGSSSNGATYKIPGRVGDAPLPGAGAYADSKVGAAVATGDGDVMMRFLPTYLMVELMRMGKSPKYAATEAITRIANYYPNFSGALIAVRKDGTFYAACHGMAEFPFSVASVNNPQVTIHKSLCQNYTTVQNTLRSIDEFK